MATEQIANSIQEVAAGTERQTTMVKETNSIIREMSLGMERVREHSGTVANESLEAASIVSNGNEAIQLSTNQMENIQDTIQNLGNVIHTLGERSKEINQIIDVISDIASQTNLLALNAAIEAARAGEHGKGFAVVADEVRKLAEQSSKSTETIRHLISSIQTDTNQAVSSMDKGKTEFAKGMDLVKSAGEAFQKIDQFVNHTNVEFQEVSASIKEAVAGAEHVVEIATEIEEITSKATGETQDVSAATEEQLASMQEIAASAATLAEMAEELQDAVKKFKI
ncbi:methyl-accepting chemotaxis protein [Bacillus sp. EB600]|uniref:methyl-accepting chemotaxis protein n=1 Tax=Bacillus sp. EB600 TaxID=2806345 RepID=UPI0035BEBF99